MIKLQGNDRNVSIASIHQLVIRMWYSSRESRTNPSGRLSEVRNYRKGVTYIYVAGDSKEDKEEDKYTSILIHDHPHYWKIPFDLTWRGVVLSTCN